MMVTAFVLCLGEALLCWNEEVYFLRLPRLLRKMLHAVWNLLGLCAASAGLAAVFKFHNQRHILNLYSLHSWIGVLTFSFLGMQWLFGFFSYVISIVPESIKSASVPIHRFFGVTVFVLGLATCASGFLEKLTFLQSSALGITKFGAESMVGNFCGIILIIVGLVVTATTLNRSRVHGESIYNNLN